MSASVLYDVPGPRGRRRIWIGSTIVLLVIAWLVVVAIGRLADHHQLDSARWKFLTNAATLRFLFYGLLNTLKAALVAGLIALVAGGLLAVGRLSPLLPVRAAATTYVQFGRAIPLLPLLLFINLGFPQMGLDLPVFWFLVIGLALYNSAVFAEIYRAGVLSLHRGQQEAAYALGLTFAKTMRLVLLPQAIRRMVPALVGQYVVLLKDSSLGFVLPYPELLRRGEITGQFTHSVLQAYIVVAVIYIAVNASLSYLARRLESRQARRQRALTVVAGRASLTAAVVPGTLDVSAGAVLDAGVASAAGTVPPSGTPIA
jgi:glutamate transport system permease protein